jgi:hypothetical protein
MVDRMNLTLAHRKQTRKETAVITTTARVPAREARPRGRTNALLWAAQILLACSCSMLPCPS